MRGKLLLVILSVFLLAGFRGALVSSNGASTYEGLVGTRGFVPSHLSTFTQAQTRTAIFIPGPGFSQVKFDIANYYGAEIAPGSAATDTGSVEYPQGTCTPVKKTGSTTITVADGGHVTTDYAVVTVAGPTWIWYRGHFSNPSGIVIDAFQGQNAAIGDALVLGNSVPDQTVTCDPVIDSGSGGAIIAPVATIAQTTAPSVCIVGDSIPLGVDNDHFPNSVGDPGVVAPIIGPAFGYSLLAVNGDTSDNFVTNHANRGAILPYCTHIDVEYGTNSIYLNGDSVATLKSSLTSVYALAAPGSTVFQHTLIARTCSTDFWATTANQTPYNGLGAAPCNVDFESLRVSFNSDLISGSFGPNGGYFDMQSVIGTGTNNSIWKAGSPGFTPCVPNWTNDGTHPDTCSYYSVIQSSGYLPLSRIHR